MVQKESTCLVALLGLKHAGLSLCEELSIWRSLGGGSIDELVLPTLTLLQSLSASFS